MRFLRDLEFHDPWFLLLLVPAVVAVYWGARSRRLPVLVFPTITRLRGLRPTWRQRLRFLLPVLQLLALSGLIVAAARPRKGDTRTIVQREGIAVQMVLDRSSSMENEMRYAGKNRRRIDIVRDVFRDFVAGDDQELEGRQNDLVGLTTFARFTEESCPLIALHEPLLTTVANLATVLPFIDRYRQPTDDRKRAESENPLNATAIGDGLYRAVLSLVAAEEDYARGEEEGGFKIKGKVAIVLTDGENNTGMDPIQAGRYAAENEVRIYYIVFREPFERDRFGRVLRELSPDEILRVPRQVVEPSEGRAFLARSGDELRQIYEEIDQLERTDIGRIEFRSYEERFHLFLVPGVICALVALFLSETLFRRIP